MINISFERFLDYLFSYNKIIQGELLIDNYLRYKDSYMAKPSTTKFYYTDGFAASVSVNAVQENFYNIYCYLHQISNNCDLDAAVNSCKNIINEEELKYQTSVIEMYACVSIEIAEKAIIILMIINYHGRDKNVNWIDIYAF